MPHDSLLQRISQLWLAAGKGFAQVFRSARDFELVQVPGGSLALTGLPAPDLNCGVVPTGDNAAAATKMLAGELQRRNLPGILLVPDAAGEKAGRAAEACGMIAAGRMPLMTCGARHSAAAPRFTVRRATTVGDLAAANRLIAAAFELPPDTVAAAFRPDLLTAADVAVELVYDEDVPVGCLQVTADESAVGIWSMATPPEHRRRGVARAGLQHVLSSRLSAADSRAFLIATDAGRPLYDAIGFETIAWCTAWLQGSPPQSRA